jgi:hypothetical protein
VREPQRKATTDTAAGEDGGVAAIREADDALARRVRTACGRACTRALIDAVHLVCHKVPPAVLTGHVRHETSNE